MIETISKIPDCGSAGTDTLLMEAARAVRAIHVSIAAGFSCENIARANAAKDHLCKRLREKEKCSRIRSPGNRRMFFCSCFNDKFMKAVVTIQQGARGCLPREP
jgi:hypothetical protein